MDLLPAKFPCNNCRKGYTASLQRAIYPSVIGSIASTFSIWLLLLWKVVSSSASHATPMGWQVSFINERVRGSRGPREL